MPTRLNEVALLVLDCGSTVIFRDYGYYSRPYASLTNYQRKMVVVEQDFTFRGGGKYEIRTPSATITLPPPFISAFEVLHIINLRLTYLYRRCVACCRRIRSSCVNIIVVRRTRRGWPAIRRRRTVMTASGPLHWCLITVYNGWLMKVSPVSVPLTLI